MYITKEAIKDHTGVDIDAATLATAHLMIEAWTGRSEEEVIDGSDISTLGRATMFQAVYIKDKAVDIMQQVAIDKTTLGSTVTTFNKDMFAPYMSPWAVRACKRLSWNGTRSVHVGPVLERYAKALGWEYD